MNKKNIFTKENYYLAFYSIIGAYFFRNSFLYLAALVTSSFANMTYCLSVVLTSISVLVHLFGYLKNKYVRKFGKVEKYIVNSIELLFGTLGLACYCDSMDIHLSNLAYGVDTYLLAIIVPFACICTIILPLLAMFDKRQKEEDDEIRLYPEIKKLKITSLILLSLFAFYSLASLFVSLFVLENITRYAFGFIVVLLSFVLVIYNLVFSIINLKNKCNKLLYITIALNVGELLLFILAEVIHFNFMCLVAKPFCPIDFAISLAILPTLMLIMIMGMTVYSIIGIIKNKKVVIK